MPASLPTTVGVQCCRGEEMRREKNGRDEESCEMSEARGERRQGEKKREETGRGKKKGKREENRKCRRKRREGEEEKEEKRAERRQPHRAAIRMHAQSESSSYLRSQTAPARTLSSELVVAMAQ